MCKLGDIIVVKKFKDKKGVIVSKHSFVVINDEADFIEGFSYDFIANIMCSFHSEEHKNYKLSIKSNLEIPPKEKIGKNLNTKEGYIRADELFYFNKKKINYKIIGRINDSFLNELVKLIIALDREQQLVKITDNL